MITIAEKMKKSITLKPVRSEQGGNGLAGELSRRPVAELWKVYQHTVFLMAQPLSKAVSFAIVTACNPAGKNCSDAYNQCLDKRLQASILALGCPFRSLVGASPDLSHREKSWALLLDKHEAIQLAEAYQQNAIFWVEQDQLSLIPVLLAPWVEETPMGSFCARVRGYTG